MPTIGTKPPLLREHRLYQADWLLRYYGYTTRELLDEDHQSFNPYLDPKCNWALSHMELFPVDVNRAPYHDLLRVPGIGVTSAKRIVTARRTGELHFDGLKKLGVVLKRAQYFITCSRRVMDGLKITPDAVLRSLMSAKALRMYYDDYPWQQATEQLSLFDEPSSWQEDVQKCLTGQM